jgi:hypothetical protein
MKIDSQLPDQGADISVLKNEVNDALDSLRNLSHQVHSSALDQLGLTAGLRGLCRTLSQQHHIRSIQIKRGDRSPKRHRSVPLPCRPGGLKQRDKTWQGQTDTSSIGTNPKLSPFNRDEFGGRLRSLVEAAVKTAIRLEQTSSPVPSPYSSSEEPGLQDIRPAS